MDGSTLTSELRATAPVFKPSRIPDNGKIHTVNDLLEAMAVRQAETEKSIQNIPSTSQEHLPGYGPPYPLGASFGRNAGVESAISPGNFSSLISTVEEISNLVDSIKDFPVDPPSLFIDLEGINLGRHGSISLITIYAAPLNMTFLVDVHTLQNAAFTTPSRSDPTKTLKSILEDPNVPVALFDVRNDNDALVNLFQVRMAGAIDIQLMELACRPPRRKRHVTGLGKVIEFSGLLAGPQLLDWQNTKTLGTRLFAPERGGSYEVFNQRPLSEQVAKYCVQDVTLLKQLWEGFEKTLRMPAMTKWRELIARATAARLACADDPGYDPKGEWKEKAKAPAGWERL